MTKRLLALALFSGALLLIELGITRLFATRYYPPFVFVVLSIAILGLGFGATLATLWRTLRQRKWLTHYLVGVAIGTFGLLLLIGQTIPIWLLVVVAMVPFLFGGLFLATIFSQNVAASPQFYFADLLGAGGGVVLAMPLFQWVGLLRGMAVALVFLALSALLLQIERGALDQSTRLPDDRSRRKFPLVPVGLTLLALFAAVGVRWWQPAPQQLFPNKPITERLANGGEIVATTWDGFARTDLVDPGGGLPYELYMDGAAGSVMPPAAGHPALIRDIGFFPFATEQPERIFVIGPGGGLDIWFGLQSGAQEIVAAEVNPASIDLVERFGAYNGALAEQPPVRLVRGEGRSILSRESHFYDLIFLSQVVTLAAERTGYALVENGAYTMEAVATYFAHLRPNGMIAFKLYDEPTLLRALATTVAVLQEYGYSESEALARTIVLIDPAHQPAIPLLLVRNEPFTRNDALSIGAVANDVGFQPIFLPQVWAEAPFDAIAEGRESLASFLAATPEYISPTTDRRPFFFNFERGIPQTLRPLWIALVLLLLIGVVLLGFFEKSLRSQVAEGETPSTLPLSPPQSLLYFGALGLGFMLVETSLIQQLQRFLGHPTTTVTVVLGGLLFGAGLGSFIIGHWLANQHSSQLPRWPVVGLLVTMALWHLFWPWLDTYFYVYTLPWRIAIVLCYLLPLACFMGMPFPMALRLIGPHHEKQVALAWAINGVATVAATLIAITVAMLWGYDIVLLLGWLAYLVIFFLRPISPTALPTH